MIETATHIGVEFWGVLSAMAPFLLFGFLAAGLLSVLISPTLVERHLGGGGFGPVLKAALFGVPLPLCSCGVIPVAASLRRHGASRGATTAFLISTPQTGVDSIFVTFSLLGGVFAVFRPLVALASGMIGGLAVALFDREKTVTGGPAVRCTDECCSPGAGSGGRVVRALRYGFLTLPRDIAKALLLGLIIAAFISALVPKDYFASFLGKGIVPILVMMAVGIPVYVCATASVPVAAALILHAGISPGAALAFLITGPATNAATIATVWKIMGRRTAVIYLLTVAITAVGAGLLLDHVFTVGAVGLGMIHEHAASSGYFHFQIASVIALLVVLGVALFRPTLGRLAVADVPVQPQSVALSIGGMTCSHCAETVTRALREQPGVESADVNLDTRIAVVGGQNLDAAALVGAVDALGYKAAVVETSDHPKQEEGKG